MERIIDTSSNTTEIAEALKEDGITCVTRYYCSDNYEEKRLGKIEAEALSNAGIKISVVYQNSQNDVSDFTGEKGFDAGLEAFSYARDIIGQPFGSVISFAVDFNPSDEEMIENILPFFSGVKEAFFKESDGDNTYEVGAYGSGLVCNVLLDEELCSYRWLSMADNFHGTIEALENGDYELRQVFSEPRAEILGLPVNYNLQKTHPPGSFNVTSSSLESVGGGMCFVNVREGNQLPLKSGFQIDAPIIANMKKDQIVNVIDVIDSMAYLKTEMNNEQYTGFASFEYLELIDEIEIE